MKINKKIRKKRLRNKFLKGAIVIGSDYSRVKRSGGLLIIDKFLQLNFYHNDLRFYYGKEYLSFHFGRRQRRIKND